MHLTELDQLKGYERGAVDYISVPVIPELLRAKVSVFAELRRKSRQLESLNRELEQRVAEQNRGSGKAGGGSAAVEFRTRAQEPGPRCHRQDCSRYHLQPACGWIPGLRERPILRIHGLLSQTPPNGLGWLDFVHPDDKQPSMAQWALCVESGENYECEYRLRGRDGQYRWFRARAVAIRDQTNQVIRWYGTCSDIHDSKLVEHAMRESAVELERMVDERTAALRRLSNRLMTMQDDERRRIARELHDGLGQEMVALKMLLNGIARSPLSLQEYIGDATSVIDRATQQIRTLSYLLHPPLLDEVGLLSALRWYLEGLTERSGIDTKLEVSPTEFPRLALELETAMFRIIQEALTNVFRHSGARQAWITLTQQEGEVSVKVRDDGKGVVDGIVELRSGTTGVGIRGMSERAKEFGGQLLVTRGNPGTVVEVTIPISASVSSRPQRPEEKEPLLDLSNDPIVGQPSLR